MKVRIIEEMRMRMRIGIIMRVRIGKVNVKMGLVIVDPGGAKVELDSPVKVHVHHVVDAVPHLRIIVKYIGDNVVTPNTNHYE